MNAHKNELVICKPLLTVSGICAFTTSQRSLSSSKTFKFVSYKVIRLSRYLYPVYAMKQTWSKLKAHVVHVYFWIRLLHVCFMFASSCKRGISEFIARTFCISGHRVL